MRKLFMLAVFAALALAACGGGSDEVVASVDSPSDVVVGEADNDEVAASVGGVSEITLGDMIGFFDTGEESTIPKERFADILGFEIQMVIIENASAADFGTSFTDAEIEAEAEAIFMQNAPPGTSRQEFLSSNGLTEAFLSRVAQQQLIQTSVQDAILAEMPKPSQEEIDSQMEAVTDSLIEVCARHILVETEAEANTVLERLEAGESFEDLALELSQDPGSGQQGGDLGCSHPSRYVPEFDEATRTAEIDQVTDPVQTDFGYHVILVYERNEPLASEDDVVANINSAALGQAVNDWFVAAVNEAVVEVNEKYGTWQTNPPSVRPPA